MSSFDTKQLSEQDQFRLEVARAEEASLHRSSDANGAPPTTALDRERSPVAKVVEQIMSHWADDDSSLIAGLVAEVGEDHFEKDGRLKKVVGQSELLAKPLGMTGDFNPDSAEVTEALDLPPKLDGGQFGGGGGGGGGGGSGGDGDAGLEGEWHDTQAIGSEYADDDYIGDYDAGFSSAEFGGDGGGAGGGAAGGSGTPTPPKPPADDKNKRRAKAKAVEPEKAKPQTPLPPEPAGTTKPKK